MLARVRRTSLRVSGGAILSASGYAAGFAQLTLLVQKDDTFKTLELRYGGGERYPNLVRQAGSAGLLGLIAGPRAPLPARH